MTPQDFITKWRPVELKERSTAQSHFNDLCRLLGVDDPVFSDPKGEWFAFEHGVAKASGGDGWADVWRKDCFGWEYKGKHKDLKAALKQLLNYSGSMGSPPLLIVSDTDRIEIHTNWNNTVQTTHHITLDDLIDAKKRDLLRACFTNPERLKPEKTRQALTEDAAQKFAAIADRLRLRGHDPQTVAHFINRLVFCMFAEDVELLPESYFSQMIDRCANRNDYLFAQYASTLFAAMRTGGHVGFDKIEWFNGGLFDNDLALPLTYQDIDDLKRAAHLDWSAIDPSIMGTLFERGLDPDKRSQLGAHYTDRDKIMQIVDPVIKLPLQAEWAEVLAKIDALLQGGARNARDKAEGLHLAFVDRLVAFRILDPACGSGNFLSLALQVLKQIEHQANNDCFDRGLQRVLTRTGPENMLGIELNPYAAELARVSVWIGDIQWSRRNGLEPAKNPILRTLDTIECRDAVLGPDGKRAEWPKADVVVGNPPFKGSQRMLREFGIDYTQSLRSAWEGRVPTSVNFVTYWFAKAWDAIKSGDLQRAGLVATNSIREGANRTVLKQIADGGVVFDAWSNEPWVVDGAAVRVSLVCFAANQIGQSRLDGKIVQNILADLTANTSGFDLTNAKSIPKNLSVCVRGIETGGPFEINHSAFARLSCLPLNPNSLSNNAVLRPIVSGTSVKERAEGEFVIDFHDFPSETEAALFEGPFATLQDAYKTYGKSLKRKVIIRSDWWLHRRSGTEFRTATQGIDRFIVTPRVSKHRVFMWLSRPTLPDSRFFVIPRSDNTFFGILSSSIHEKWSLATCAWHGVGNTPTYRSETCFETFPFPEHLTPDIPSTTYAADPRARAIATAAARLNELRENWLNPPDLVKRVPEVVPGYPDRLLPVSPEAAAILKKRTLTNLYNARPAWLDHAHKALDDAVADAYGWGDDWKLGKMTDDDILSRLFHLNQDRAARQ